jgi:hypothetical protein
MKTVRTTPFSQRALDGRRGLPHPYEKNASLGLGKTFGHRVNFVCADCEEPLAIGDKGAECPRCKRWPLCQSCMPQHVKSLRLEANG